MKAIKRWINSYRGVERAILFHLSPHPVGWQGRHPWMTADEIVRRTGKNKTSVFAHLLQMERDGVIAASTLPNHRRGYHMASYNPASEE